MTSFVLRRIGFYVLICAITLFFAVPMLWIASAPFDASPGLGVHWPDWTLENFRKTLDHPYAMHSMINSLLICITTAVAVTAFAALASYALSRVRIPGRDALLYGLLLLSSVVTGTAAMVPIFVMMFQLGLIDSRFGVALVMTGGLLPAAIFILKDFVDAVPKSYEESARVFGASTGQILRDVVLPVARPGLATIMVWAFVNSWGNFLVPFLLLRGPDKAPAAVIMYTLYTEGGQADLRLLSTFSLLYSLPVALMFVFVSSRYGFRFHGGIKR